MSLAPTWSIRRLGDRCEDQHHQAAGRHPEAGGEDGLPEAVAGRAGQLSSWGTTIACAIIPKPIATAATLVSSTGQPRGGPQVDQRLVGWRSSSAAQPSSTTTPAAIAAERAAVAPAPGAGLGDADEQRHQSDGEADRADDVEAAAGVPSCTCGTATTARAAAGPRARRRPRRGRASRRPARSRPTAAGRWRRRRRGWRSSRRSRWRPAAAGSISRIRAMPTGMKPIARPCRARPASIGASVLGQRDDDRADRAGSRRWRPAPAACRTGRRAGRLSGIATAPASRVIGDDPGRVGRRGRAAARAAGSGSG